jgi:general stress protein CsbA
MSVLRSEWIKTRTIRMNWVLFVIAIVFPLVVAGLVAGFSDAENLLALDQFQLVSGGIIITSMLLGVIGATSITGEYEIRVEVDDRLKAKGVGGEAANLCEFCSFSRKVAECRHTYNLRSRPNGEEHLGD